MDTLVLHWKTSQWIQSINHFKNIQYQSGLLFRTTVPSMLSEIFKSAIVIIYDFNKRINSISVCYFFNIIIMPDFYGCIVLYILL